MVVIIIKTGLGRAQLNIDSGRAESITKAKLNKRVYTYIHTWKRVNMFEALLKALLKYG